MQIIKELSGHSGCNIYLCSNSKGSLFVKKVSGSPDYNERLFKQASRQDELTGMGISMPKILHSGYEDGKYFFTMEYIKGRTLISHIGDQKADFDSIVKQLIEILLKMNGNRKYRGYFRDRIATKTVSVLANKKFYSMNTQPMMELISRLPEKEYNNICHGDLTLENIMIDENGKLWLIDCLDSFIEHSHIDIAKIYQDLEANWYRIKNLRNKDFNVPITKVKVFKEKFDEAIKENFPDYFANHNCLLTLTIMRIVPYTNDDRQLEMLLNIIKGNLWRATNG